MNTNHLYVNVWEGVHFKTAALGKPTNYFQQKEIAQ